MHPKSRLYRLGIYIPDALPLPRSENHAKSKYTGLAKTTKIGASVSFGAVVIVRAVTAYMAGKQKCNRRRVEGTSNAKQGEIAFVRGLTTADTLTRLSNIRN